MTQRPVKASGFIKLPKEIQDILIYNGAVPVNDIFFPYWDNKSKIFILYGGYGSGKSVFMIDRLLNYCLNDEYFRCFYGRKVYDSVRVSIFLTLTDRIEERGLQDKFTYSKSDNSSMIIRSNISQGTFNPFGADKPEKLQSVKDPSHILMDEMDQFTMKDIEILASRLRKPDINASLWGAFNTTHVKDSHWLKKTFFTEQGDDFKEFTVTKVFCNYTDNKFLNIKQYEEILWLSAGYNEQKFNEISAGEWGAEEIGNPFIFNFDRRKHIIKGLEYIDKLPVLISFDFNVDPITCIAGQVDIDDVRILDEFRILNSDIYELCARIESAYPDKMLLVTGDASGQSRTALKRDMDYYKVIRQQLRLGMGQFKLAAANPPIKKTRILCNALLKKHVNYHFSDRVPYLITDIESTQVDAEGDIDESKDKHRGHLLACWRYFNYTFLRKFINDSDL